MSTSATSSTSSSLFLLLSVTAITAGSSLTDNCALLSVQHRHVAVRGANSSRAASSTARDVTQQHVRGVSEQKMSGNTEDIKPVKCTIKPPVYLQIGDAKTDPAHSGVCVVDVTLPFGKPVNIEEITFKNYYTAYVTVRLLRRSPGQETPAKWCTALRDLPLMDNPHTERGSQDYYSIHRTQMQVEPDHVVSVRLILRQPSSAWLTFSLEDVRIYPHMEPDPEKEVSDWLSDLTLVDQHPDLEGLPDPQTVSSSIQQMWALTEVMQTNQTTASIGRFDVDGCYDINLLSLT